MSAKAAPYEEPKKIPLPSSPMYNISWEAAHFYTGDTFSRCKVMIYYKEHNIAAQYHSNADILVALTQCPATQLQGSLEDVQFVYQFHLFVVSFRSKILWILYTRLPETLPGSSVRMSPFIHFASSP
jgi:hypothetical protein